MRRDRPDISGDQSDASSFPAGVALEWARALVAASPARAPLAPLRLCSEIQKALREPTERLITALSGPGVDTQAAADVGGQLVAEGFTGPQTLPRTFEVLGAALRGVTGAEAFGSPCDRIIELLGALASGYVWALRSLQDSQHDELKRALLQAGLDPGRDGQGKQSWFRQVFDRSPVGITISDLDGRIVHTNRSMEDALGLAPGELVGRHLRELFAPGQWTLLAGKYRGLVASRADRLRVRSALRRPDDTAMWIHLDASLLRSTEVGPQHVVTMTADITDQYLLEQRLTHQALHDLQTGLPNRQYLTTHLERVLARLEPSQVLTLLHLDLDGFTAINDSLGPEAGDHLLEVAARRLESVLAKAPGMVARLGTDEFAILLEPPREASDPVPEVGALAEAINAELSEPFYHDETGVALTATIGAIQRRAGGASARELMRAADATLRRVCGLGTRQWALYDPDLDSSDRITLRLAAGLPGALETGELQTTFQPVVTLEDQRLVGVEAAVCWAHPQSGLLSHDQCVHAAEQTGAVHELGQWLLRTAAEQAVRWRENLRGDLPPVVINLAPSQVRDPDLVRKVRAVLNETGVEPTALELRAPAAAIRIVTGELAGEGGGQAEDNLRVLAELGVRAGLYDFGGGIGCLRCLADLPIRTVRIAEPISQQVAADPSRILSQAAQALVHIVRGAGIDVVAYPVDSAEQAACWPWIGANWALGALFGAPGPPAGIEPLIESSR